MFLLRLYAPPVISPPVYKLHETRALMWDFTVPCSITDYLSTIQVDLVQFRHDIRLSSFRLATLMGLSSN